MSLLGAGDTAHKQKKKKKEKKLFALLATTLPQEFQLTKRLCGTRVGSQTTLAPTWDSTVVINHQRCLSTGSDRNGEM